MHAQQNCSGEKEVVSRLHELQVRPLPVYLSKPGKLRSLWLNKVISEYYTSWLHILRSQSVDPSVSVHLALLLTADRLADERSLDVEAEIGP